MRIIGIDPGSINTGFGVIEKQGQKYLHLDNGVLKVQGEDVATRLALIFRGVQDLVQQYKPDVVAVETVFLNRNFQSALKLGQARGAAIAAAAVESIKVVEYSPAQIKQAVVGKGNADKHQVQYMVKMILGLSKKPVSDAADALACALCHSHFNHLQGRMAVLHEAGKKR